ncbi:aldo/keto reductase [Streptomyces sp. NPDC001889]
MDGRLLDALAAAVENGAAFIDTSDAYGKGRSERIIGEFLRACPGAPVRLSSKTGSLRGSAAHPYAGRRLSLQLQQTLENLGVEELDLYTLESLDFGPEDRYLGPLVEQVHALRDLGYIRAIGVRVPELSAATAARRTTQIRRLRYVFEAIRPDVLWTRFDGSTSATTMVPETGDLFSFAAREGVGVVVAASLPRPSRDGSASAPGERLPQRTCGDAGALGLLALRHALHRANCVVVADWRSPFTEVRRLLSTPLTAAGQGTAEAMVRASVPLPAEFLAGAWS